MLPLLIHTTFSEHMWHTGCEPPDGKMNTFSIHSSLKQRFSSSTSFFWSKPAGANCSSELWHFYGALVVQVNKGFDWID